MSKKSSINDVLKECLARGLTEEDTVFELVRRFPASVIRNLGGQRKIKELYAEALVPKPQPHDPADDQYKLEIPGGSVELFAANDAAAQVKARDYLRDNLLLPVPKRLKLFRYPKEYVDKKTGGLIEIPFMI